MSSFLTKEKLEEYWGKVVEKTIYMKQEEIFFFTHCTTLTGRKGIQLANAIIGHPTNMPLKAPLARNLELTGVWFEIHPSKLPTKSPYGNRRLAFKARSFMTLLSCTPLVAQGSKIVHNGKRENETESKEVSTPDNDEKEEHDKNEKEGPDDYFEGYCVKNVDTFSDDSDDAPGDDDDISGDDEEGEDKEETDYNNRICVQNTLKSADDFCDDDEEEKEKEEKNESDLNNRGNCNTNISVIYDAYYHKDYSDECIERNCNKNTSKSCEEENRKEGDKKDETNPKHSSDSQATIAENNYKSDPTENTITLNKIDLLSENKILLKPVCNYSEVTKGERYQQNTQKIIPKTQMKSQQDVNRPPIFPKGFQLKYAYKREDFIKDKVLDTRDPFEKSNQNRDKKPLVTTDVLNLFLECCHFYGNQQYLRVLLIKSSDKSITWCNQNLKWLDIHDNPFLKYHPKSGKIFSISRQYSGKKTFNLDILVVGDIPLDYLSESDCPNWDKVTKIRRAGRDPVIGIVPKHH